MKCNDCGSSKAYLRKGLAWRLCKPCWDNMAAVLNWASRKAGKGDKKKNVSSAT